MPTLQPNRNQMYAVVPYTLCIVFLALLNRGMNLMCRDAIYRVWAGVLALRKIIFIA
ncbi:hypothetical protein ACF3DV_30640 [Chlorogloeopsis fritschii PCC 9212]|uniref:hypothetical protein n=1 Tax=Chlorogloeopsis fritschii TaxID=1124 RepID=UPI0012F6CC4D|nr:hypothetical protein [Chlorogloeopsis fritschii]